jgi:sigma-B regulation protein RsbU (phosphoserine phosphatase)
MGLGRSLAAKLALALLGGCLAVYLFILVDVHRWTREILEEYIRREGANVIDAAEARIDSELLRVQDAPVRIAHGLAEQLPSRAALERELCASVAATPTVFGSAAAFEPHAFDPGLSSFSPYCYREGAGMAVKDLGQEGYDYPRRAWYRLPKERGRPLWSEPYFDEGGGGILMATYSVPFRKGPTGPLLGIATADVALEWLQRFMSGIHVGRAGYAFLASREGRIVTHPDPRLAMKADLATLAAERGDRGILRLAQAIGAGRGGFERVRDLAGGAPAFVVFRPLTASGWNLAVVFPERETRADIQALDRRMWLTGLGGALLLALVVVAVSRRITRPLAQLTRAAQEVAGGRMDAPLPPVAARDEVGRLTASFAEMQTALSGYIDAVKQKAAVEERLESELRIARQIQMSLVPRPEDLSTERLGCEVFGLIDPARAVGGDLFDVVRRGNGEVSFVIGDVSDKGIPAALFMAVTDIHFEAAARDLAEPEAILARINDALVAENRANMFVTLVSGVFDVRSGRLALASGGHPPPVLLPRDGPPRLLEVEGGTVVGVVPGLTFARFELRLEVGDAIVLYTDGVTEAHDAKRVMFGEERLLAHLRGQPPGDARSVTEALREAVRSFAGEAPQFDDIAILVLRRTAPAVGAAAAARGPVGASAEVAAAASAAPATESEARREITSAAEELAQVRAWLDGWCAARGVGEAARHDLDLALDEVIANVIRHGYGEDAPGPIALRLSLAGDRVRLEIADRAAAFNPLDAPDPGSRPVEGGGGLGIQLLRQFMDRVEYVREKGENRLVLERRRGGP